MIPEKKWWQSKIVWFNSLMTLLYLAVYAEQTLSPEFVPYALVVQGVVNVLLRVWFTETKITTPFSNAEVVMAKPRKKLRK